MVQCLGRFDQGATPKNKNTPRSDDQGIISSLICVSAVTREPAGGLWLVIFPEVGEGFGRAVGWVVLPASTAGVGWSRASATETLASCNPARAIFSLASESWRPTKFGITYSNARGACASRILIFGERTSPALGDGTCATT